MLARYQDIWWHNPLVPNARIYVNKEMIRNLSATIHQIAEETAKNTAAQQTSLNSLAKVVLDNRVALDVLLAKQGGVSAIAHTTCCNYINTAGEVETCLEITSRKARWLQDVRKTDPLSDLFNWHPSGISYFFHSALQMIIIFIIYVIILF